MSDVMDTQAEDGLDPTATDDNQSEPQALPTIEEIALSAGWKPEDQWKGDKTKWTPAHEFLAHKVAVGEEHRQTTMKLNKQVERMSRASEKMLEKALEDQRRELEADLADAVAANKPGEAAKIVRKIDGLKPVDDDPAAEFKERNAAWYGVDEDATAYAYGIAEQKKHLPPQDQLDAVEAAVKRKFPELFGGVLKRQAPVVGAPTTRAPAPRAKTFDSLPPDAKAACLAFEKKGLKRENYVASYYQENAQ